MDGGMKYYRRYVGDYLRDTSRLSMLEHGAYTLMLDYYYADERPLPKDRFELYTMLRALKPEDQRAVDKVLGLYFEERSDGWHQRRVDAELETANKVIDAARENGRLGGRPKNPEETSEATQPVTALDTSDGTSGITSEVTSGLTENESRSEPRNNHPPSTNHQPLNHQPPTPRAEVRATRLPPTWEPSEEQIAWALGSRPNWTPEHVQWVAEMFRDHWLAKSGADATKRDWSATWRNWVKREKSDPRRDSRTSNGVAL